MTVNNESGQDPDVGVRRRRKGIYILPNLFTLAALFSGFYAIVMAINGHFDLSAYGVFSAMIFDSLDGRVARMTNTQSAFGEQMDSLADMVSFGAAPALIVYVWALKGLGRWGWIAAFVYCACAALRLARFNVNTAVVERGFSGHLSWPQASWIAFAITLYAGLTMVTNVPFYSFKDVQARQSVPFVVLVLIALGIAVINIDPPSVLFLAFACYSLSGYAIYGWRKSKGQPVSVISMSKDEPDERGLHD